MTVQEAAARGRIILGIDPGLDGALAFLDPASGALTVYDMPTIAVARAGKTAAGNPKSKRDIDMYELGRIVDAFGNLVLCAYIENVHASPQMGVTSAFSMGQGLGVLLMSLAANFIPIQKVEPAVWKRILRVPADKNGARARASQIMPAHSGLWTRAKDDGRAEASMIAVHGAKERGLVS